MARNRLKVLVTGGAGFIGANLIKSLLSKGYDVLSMDDYSTGSVNNHQFGCKYLNHSIVNITEYPDVDVVFHLAALARIIPSFDNPAKYFSVNAQGTLNLAKWCADNNIPIIYAGSSSHHSGRFQNPYTFTKDIGEDVLTLFQKHYGLKCSIGRFYNVYGTYHVKQGAYCTLLGNWEGRLEQGKELFIYGDGTKRRDFTHVNDIVNALELIYTKGQFGHIFELGRGINYSVNEIAEMYNILDRVKYTNDKPGEAQSTLCTHTLAKELLGWEPTENILNYIETYKNENSSLYSSIH